MTETLSEKLKRFPRVGVCRPNTPLEPLKRLTACLGGPRLWVKREDMTGLGCGGNKLRKLDFVLHEALESGADTLVSGGVVQSNSQRQVAAAAARLGLECHLAVYHGRVTAPSAEYETSGNALLNRLFGAQLHHVTWDGDRNAAITSLCDRLREQGKRPFMIPYGVSSALGAVGYASAVTELAAQSRSLGITPAAIVHCSGSGATQAGLAIGAALELPTTDVVGIDIDAEPTRVRDDVARFAMSASELLEIEFRKSSIEVVAGHAGPAYGVPHAATIDALKIAGSLEGLVLDPVYSAKGLAGLMALAREGRWSKEDNVIFIHTGGSPALFAYAGSLEI